MKKFLTLLTLLLIGVSWSFAGADFTYVYNDATQSLTLSKARNVSGEVVIPESAEYDGQFYPVTSIGDYAFSGCNSLTSVIIPDSVISIGKEAFSHCEYMTSVTIGNSVTSIGNEAFYYCSGLTSVIIPDSVTSIGNEAFCNCLYLTSVTIPASVTSIGYGAFKYCYRLTSIDVNSENPIYASLEGMLFNKDLSTLIQCPEGKVGDYIVPDSVTSIGASAFHSCYNLTSVTIPDSVTSIGASAFHSCYNLTSVTIPDSVTSIGNEAFYDCVYLTSVTIGNSVTSIGDRTFSYCTGLTSVTIGNSVTSIGNSAFNQCTSLTSVTIPDSVTSISGWAFYECYGLTSLTIGNSVTSISIDAFSDCRSLKYVYCLVENPPYCHYHAFGSSNKEAILYVQPTSLDDYIDASNDDNSGWSFFRNRIYSYTQLAEELFIDPTEIVAYAGDSLTIKATVLPENTTDKRLAWESSNENVAVVSQEGLVSVLHDGECEIIVRTVDGSDLSAVCKIKVMTSGIEGIDADENAVYEVYSLNGVLIDPSADAEAVRSLAPGMYILKNDKGITKLIK